MDNQCGEEGAEERRQDKCGGPDVDLARVFVEEVNVLDEHQTTSSSDDGEEAVEDTCGHERGKVCGCCAPGGCAEGQALEEQEDGQTAEVGGPPDDEEAAGAQHEDVPGCGVVDGVGAQMPLPVEPEC